MKKIILKSLLLFCLLISWNIASATEYICTPGLYVSADIVQNTITGSTCSGNYYGNGLLDFQIRVINGNQITFGVRKHSGETFHSGTDFYIKESTSSSYPDLVCGTAFPPEGKDIGGKTGSNYTISMTHTGTRYYCAVTVAENGEKYYSGRISVTGTEAPFVQTGSAFNITTTTATISGNVNPNGLSTTYCFQWGITTSYGSSACADVGDGTTSKYKSKVIDNLLPATTYHYQIVAVNTKGTSLGEDKTFTTDPSFLLQQNSEMGFYESASYSTKVQNLEIGKTYYFKAIIKNNGGTSFSGNLYLKKGLGSSYSNYISFLNNSIGANGGLKTITGTYTPSALESNISLGLYYSDGASNQGQVIGGDYSQNITVSFIDPASPSCATYSDCTSSDNCPTNLGLPQAELYNAVQYLCENNIIDSEGDADGNVRVDENLKRQQLAKMAFLALFGGTEPAANALPSDNCQSPYLDLQDKTTYYYRYAKALLFLEYGDGISPFSRDFALFNPEGGIQRLSVLKLLLETFNIAPNNSGSSYSDLPNTAENYGYARKANDLGIITVPSNFVYPERYCTRGELFIMLARLLDLIENGTINAPMQKEIYNGFYLTGFVSPKTLSSSKNIETGNFNHYSKSSFVIPGRNLSMNFEHMYNSYLTTLPSVFFPVQPLGNGWSHTYNSFITPIEGETSADKRWFITWPDGSVHVYYKSGSIYKCESNGIYDKLTETVSGTKFELRKKNQLVFTFEKIDSYNGAYLLTSLRDRNNNSITINYETANNAPRIKNVTDALGRKLLFTYKTGTNLLQTVIDPLSRVIIFAYTNNKLTEFTDAKGLKTYYQYGTNYDDKYLLTRITLPKGNVITNTYFQQKLKSTQVTGAANSLTEVDMDQNYSSGGNNFITSTVKTKTGNSSTITSNYAFNSNGMVTNLTDNASTDVSAEYNNAAFPTIPSRITNERTNALVELSNVDSEGNVRSITRKADGKTYTTTMTYTSLNDIATMTDARGNQTTYNYTNGNLTRVSDPMGNQTNMAYNAYGQLTSITNPLGIQTSLAYDGNTGQVNRVNVPALSLSATSDYDTASRKTSATNFKGQETLFEYDNNDNLTKTTKVAAHNGQDVVTTHSFDNNDNLTSIVNALNRTTSFTYDSQTDWLLSESFGGATKSYTYNSDGSLKRFTKPNGEFFNYEYDNLGRIINNGYATFDFDATSGNLNSIDKDGKAIDLSYDGFNRIESVLYDGKTVSYTYDEVDNLKSITYPDGKTVNYRYNANNQLIEVEDWNLNLTSYTYNAAGQLTSSTYPNGLVTTYTYDNAGRQTGLKTKRANNTVIAEYTYTLDDLGNHLSEAINEPFTTMPSIDSETISYTYNNANRIQTAGSVGFDFDANGNTTRKGSSNLSYDKANNLLSVSGEFSATYTYDGMGIRRKAIRNGETTKYIMNPLGMGNVLMETDASGNVLQYYVYGLGLISRVASDGESTGYYVYDYRGSTIAITDDTQAANITHQYQYDDFGNVLQAEETDLNRFRYVGKYGVMYESDDLVYMRARYYDPTIGRFLSEDPIWSTNLYPYADNNPITFIDPKGEMAEMEGVGIDVVTFFENSEEGMRMRLAYILVGVPAIVVTYGDIGTVLTLVSFTYNAADLIDKTIIDPIQEYKQNNLYMENLDVGLQFYYNNDCNIDKTYESLNKELDRVNKSLYGEGSSLGTHDELIIYREELLKALESPRYAKFK